MPAETHGGLNPDELRAAGIDPAQALNFSVNVNPYSPPPGVRVAIAALDLARYPDGEARDRWPE